MGFGMKVRRVFAGAAVAAVLALAGCSGSGSGGGSGPAGGDTAAKPAAGGEAAKPAAAGEADAPVPAEALCAHLKKELPRITTVGSEVGATAQLAISIADLYGDNVDKLDHDVIEAQAAKSCPDTRAALLKATGLDSFSEL